MRKSTFASIASLCMVPAALLWSQDSSAVPAFARKYQTSCYTCHSGFPNRNAFGEAFKNNGYRWPGGEEEDHAKQEQTKMGGEGWKKIFPESPWPTDIPGFAPFALQVSGPMVNYADEQKYSSGAKNGKIKTAQTLNQGGPIDVNVLYGGTIGENLSVVGLLRSFAAGATSTELRATWAFSPGVNLGFGNGFGAFKGLSTPISVYTGIFPASGTATEFNYAVGKEGGFNLIAGVASAGTTNSTEENVTTANTSSNRLDDTRYARLKYKFFGAGLLSGAGGTYGNEYVGLDNSLAIGASLVSARDGILTGTYSGETLVYGADIAGNYGNFTAGVAYSRDSDLKLNNYAVDAGYYVYPWLLARVKYTELGAAGGLTNPTWTPSLTAWLRANVSLAASYKAYAKNIAPIASGDQYNNANTFTLTGSVAF